MSTKWGMKMNIKRIDINGDLGGQELSLLKALSGIYLTLHVVDLKNLLIYEYATTENVHRLMHGEAPLEMRVRRVMDGVVVREHKAQAYAFTDLGTLQKRMRNRDVIRTEFVSIYSGWIEASFVALQRKEGEVTWVVFATRVINERKEREERLRRRSNTDEVTGFFNRRAYEEVIASHPGTLPADDFVFVAFDINGLKEVNDSLGHSAGDELLRGAAACINECFGKFGQIFRTGGDEFVALLFIEAEKMLDVGFNFEKRMAAWRGARVKELSISWGSAAHRDYPRYTVQELARVADRGMYKAKEYYYTQNGMDRRVQRSIYDVICSTYTKALQVDLTTDTYHILQMDGLEHDESYGFRTTIGAWLHDFAVMGGVHEDNLAEYLEKTKLNSLREYFRAGKKQLSFTYLRNIRGTYRKVLMEIIPAPEYTPTNEQVFLFVKDIDKV